MTDLSFAAIFASIKSEDGGLTLEIYGIYLLK